MSILSVLGKKAGSTLRYLGFDPLAVHAGLIDASRICAGQEIIEPIMEQFLTGEYDAVEVVYSRFISAARQVPDRIGLLPAGGAQEGEATEDASSGGEYIFHPDARRLVGFFDSTNREEQPSFRPCCKRLLVSTQPVAWR